MKKAIIFLTEMVIACIYVSQTFTNYIRILTSTALPANGYFTGMLKDCPQEFNLSDFRPEAKQRSGK